MSSQLLIDNTILSSCKVRTFLPVYLALLKNLPVSNMSSIGPSPPKGSPEDRQIWKDWGDHNGAFVLPIICERRLVSHDGIGAEDIRLLGRVEKALINLFHFANRTTERWPQTIRAMLTKLGEEDTECRPFAVKVGLGH
jgi:hypothetical protein